jgi:hypothetical protein
MSGPLLLDPFCSLVANKVPRAQGYEYSSALSIYLWLCSPFVAPWPHFQFLNPIHSRYDSLDGGGGVIPSQGRYLHTEQHKHRINAHRHSCLEWDSNPPSQRSSELRQFMPYTARPLWSHSSTLFPINLIFSSFFFTLNGFLFYDW